MRSIRARTERRPLKVALVDALVALHVANLAARGLRAVGLGDVVGEVLGLRADRERMLRRDLAIHQRGFLESAAYAVHVRRIEGIVAEARSLDAAVAVIRIVAYHTGGGGGTERSLAFLGEQRDRYDFAQIDAALAQILSRAGASYRRFPPTAAQPTADLYFPWDGHLSVRGQALLAAALEPVLDRSMVGVGDGARVEGNSP